MIAEKLAYDDSLDLYRHSVELSNHVNLRGKSFVEIRVFDHFSVSKFVLLRKNGRKAFGRSDKEEHRRLSIWNQLFDGKRTRRRRFDEIYSLKFLSKRIFSKGKNVFFFRTKSERFERFGMSRNHSRIQQTFQLSGRRFSTVQKKKIETKIEPKFVSLRFQFVFRFRRAKRFGETNSERFCSKSLVKKKISSRNFIENLFRFLVAPENRKSNSFPLKTVLQ